MSNRFCRAKERPCDNDLCNSDLLTHSHHGLSSGEAHSVVAFSPNPTILA